MTNHSLRDHTYVTYVSIVAVSQVSRGKVEKGGHRPHDWSESGAWQGRTDSRPSSVTIIIRTLGLTGSPLNCTLDFAWEWWTGSSTDCATSQSSLAVRILLRYEIEKRTESPLDCIRATETVRLWNKIEKELRAVHWAV